MCFFDGKEFRKSIIQLTRYYTFFFHLTDFIQTLHIHIYITHRHTSTLSQFTLEQKANNRS